MYCNVCKVKVTYIAMYKVAVTYMFQLKLLILFVIYKVYKNKNSIILQTTNGRSMISAHCAVCGSMKKIFTNEHVGKALLCSLGLKIPSDKAPILNDIFF